jgi:hypothetical protein
VGGNLLNFIVKAVAPITPIVPKPLAKPSPNFSKPFSNSLETLEPISLAASKVLSEGL